MSNKSNQLEVVWKYALRGDLKKALDCYSILLGQDEKKASWPLAQIAAYQGRWADAIPYLQTTFSIIEEFCTFNVQTDAVLLAAKTAEKTNAWKDIGAFASEAYHAHHKRKDPQFHEYLGALVSYTAARGTKKLELPETINLGGVERFNEAMVKAEQKKFKTKEAWIDHFYGLARVYNCHDCALTLFKQEKNLPEIFDNAVFLASALAKAGHTKMSWDVIRQQLDCWWPVEEVQVVPVELLVDQHLQRIMTQRHCDYVLKANKTMSK